MYNINEVTDDVQPQQLDVGCTPSLQDDRNTWQVLESLVDELMGQDCSRTNHDTRVSESVWVMILTWWLE